MSRNDEHPNLFRKALPVILIILAGAGLYAGGRYGHLGLVGPFSALAAAAVFMVVWKARRRSEEAVRESEERFRSLAETASDAIISADSGGNIVFWNRAAESLFGFSADEALGRPLTLIMPERFREAHKRGMDRLLATGETRIIGHAVELAGLRKDGAEFAVELSLAKWNTRKGLFLTGVVRDITERKGADEKIRLLNDELKRHLAELEATNKELEAFSYSVSHDLRAPLRGIDGFSQALLEDYADKLDDQGKDFLERVRAGSGRMTQLIDDLLNLSRLSRSDMSRTDVDLGALADDIARGLKRTRPERNVEFVIAGGLTVKGDGRLLRLAVENLLDNAWKFSGKHPEARIEFGVREIKGSPAYFVKDNGAGFDMAYAGKLFSPFQRLHGANEFPGTGIGLATVQRIVRRHGGRVWAEAELGKGATFYFTLG